MFPGIVFAYNSGISGDTGDSVHPDLTPALLFNSLDEIEYDAARWSDLDQDGDLDLLLISHTEAGSVSWVFDNQGSGLLLAAAQCSTSNGVITCEGDQSDGVYFNVTSNMELLVQNLTANITPAEGDCGVKVTNLSGRNTDGRILSLNISETNRTITTQGNSAHGILAFSQGGNGEDGKNNGFLSEATSGKMGGSGGSVSVTNLTSITTNGEVAHGISANSRGGKGGNGGDANFWLSIAVSGGNGASGGNGGQIEVCNQSSISTFGNLSHGILGFSAGGKGGDGGDGRALIWAQAGDGGAGGSGGTVHIINRGGSITTEGSNSCGILAQSVGGSGGAAGHGGSLFYSGGDGKPGGEGGEVAVDNMASILTKGDSSFGIFAQSVGGFGGDLGVGGGLISFGGIGGTGGNAGVAYINNQSQGKIETQGDYAHALFAQSIGGGGGGGSGVGGLVSLGGVGGGGGHGGIVHITNDGQIETLGVGSIGIFAQSVGGGGGDGGHSGGLISIGGRGTSAANGAYVQIINSGSVKTSGEFSHAVFAQSIGGGGGNGGCSGGALSFGGQAGKGGNGEIVKVYQNGEIQTLGNDANGVFAQSVGGGGGNGGASGAGFIYGSLAVGGEGGDGGDGGQLFVQVLQGSINTQGDRSRGIQAQSIGGGGGNGGFAFSLAGGDVFGGSLSVGGNGGNGGDGDRVDLVNQSEISTGGNFSQGILAQSVGGGGGSGGVSLSLSGSGQVALPVSIGGTGGLGGDGDIVIVTNEGAISTTGKFSHGIQAQSVGGGGGNGGASISGSASGAVAISASIGGNGDSGGNAGDVMVSNSGQISTSDEGSIGIFAQSVGGGGGSGGFSLAASAAANQSLALSFGGAGASGGNGNKVTASNSGDLTTTGNFSSGILVQSVGGGGGNGGAAIAGAVGGKQALTATFGGNGASGGSGDDVSVESEGNITTKGRISQGLVAQSIGGGGGNGGLTMALSAAEKGTLNFGLGGNGGNGGNAGMVQVQNSGEISTHGFASTGVLAQSIGGGGGSGGASLSGTGSGDGTGEGSSVSISANIGGLGGNGGRSEKVDVTNEGSITTRGKFSDGIFAQSIGGGGGSGGLSGNLVAMADYYVSLSLGGLGGSGGAGGEVNVVNDGVIKTSGFHSRGIFAQSIGGGGGTGGSSYTIGGYVSKNSASVSIGGDGGEGGNAAEVSVVNSGSIETSGGKSDGIFAQSVGGGGGEGGTASNFLSLPEIGFWGGDGVLNNLNLGVSVGGNGGTAGDGDVVTVNNSGDINTSGALSRGIFAQSIGGGGGSGGNGVILGFGSDLWNDLSAVVDPSAAGTVAVGGSSGASGHGSSVSVTNSGNISTNGLMSHGIFAQSVGAGGGEAQNYLEDTNSQNSAGINGLVNVGGSIGAAGNGGEVVVINEGSTQTSGAGAYGIFAQSVGGGGGVGGDVSIGFNPFDLGFDTGWGRGGGNAGDGADVTVNNTGDISTDGAGAIGIFAQSVGGGGGAAGGVNDVESGETSAFAGSVGGHGSSGEIVVTQVGTIQTSGEAAHGIIAQSAGGLESSADVSVTVDGDILLQGADACGIIAQSFATELRGDITIDILGGTIQGGSGTGTGIMILDGVNNRLTNRGIITTLDGFRGMAIISTSGCDTVCNHGQITGSVDLGGGDNAIINDQGALFEAGTVLNVGADGKFVNDGIFSPGGASVVVTTEFTGIFEQTDNGTFEVSICGNKYDQLVLTDGSVDIDGALVVIAHQGVYQDGAIYNIFDLGEDQTLEGTFSSVVTPSSAFLDFSVQHLDDTVRLTADVRSFISFSTNPIEKAIAELLDAQAQDASGDFSRIIGAFQLSSTDQISDSFFSLSSATYDNLARGALQISELQQNTLAQHMDTKRSVLQNEEKGPGWWLNGISRNASQDAGGGFRAHDFTTAGATAGFEKSGNTGMIGGSFGSSSTDVDLENDLANGSIKSYVGSGYGSVIRGKTFVQAAVSYTHNKVKNSRDILVGPITRKAQSSYGSKVISSLLTSGMRLAAMNCTVEPFASVRLSRLMEDAVTEDGADTANLIIESRSSNWMASDLGVRLTRNFEESSSSLLPELTLAWRHDFALDDRIIEAAFDGAPEDLFTIEGQQTKNEEAHLGLGLLYRSSQGYNGALRFNQVLRGDYQDRVFSIQVGSNF